MDQSEDTQPSHNAGLKRALEAAAKHDLKTMLAEIVACKGMDALQRYLQRKYPTLRDDEVDAVIIQVLDEFAVKSASGELIIDPGAWLFTVAKWRGLTLVEKKRREKQLDEGEWQKFADETADYTREENESSPTSKDLYRRVYEIVPLIGSAAMQSVVRYVIEAAEQDQVVTHSQIAEALGMNPNSVSQQLRRGLDRLRQRMLAAGLVSKEFNFVITAEEELPSDDEAEEAVKHDE